MNGRRQAEFEEDMNVLVGALRGLADVEPEPTDIEALSDLAGTQKFEITALRRLVRRLRKYVDDQPCVCDPRTLPVCERCGLIGTIDTELAAIGENNSKEAEM